jgi:nitrate/nitrite transporter NarK
LIVESWIVDRGSWIVDRRNPSTIYDLLPVVTLRENLKALPKAAWILFAGTFINRFGTFVMPFLAIYLTRQGYGMAQAGAAVSAFGAGHVVASTVGGHLADRIGRRNTIAMSMFGGAASMVACRRPDRTV